MSLIYLKKIYINIHYYQVNEQILSFSQFKEKQFILYIYK